MFTFTSITQYHNNLLNGTTTCVEAVQHYLDNIGRKSSLNAFVEVYEKEALQSASFLDSERLAGKSIMPLHGVVVALKDVICYQNHTVTAGSHILNSFSSLYSATAVERLLQAGAIIIGRNNCDEFAMGSTNENSAYGPVQNAADITKVPGGSSGGSAVAVQAEMCMVSLGSDTGGSVRQPADWCGIVGLKPGYGRISRYGLIAYASSFDQIGIFSKNLYDAAKVLEVIAGEDAYDSTVSSEKVLPYNLLMQQRNEQTRPLKIAYFKEALEHPGLDSEIANAFHSYVAKLRSQGHRVEAVDFPLLQYVVPAYYVLTTAEASSNLSRYDGVKYGYRAHLAAQDDLTSLYKKSRSEGFGKEVKRRILLGTFVLSAGYYDAYFSKAQQVRRLLVEQNDQIFERYAAILSPTVPSTAFTIGEKRNNPVEMYLADIYTVYANLVGIPGVSLPLFQHSNGLPFGMQVMMPQFKEAELLVLSNYLMQLNQQ
ncbi:Asp-tRNA(Asn)/Glu-tRNA(Gln) amidotransferase subunit GatA [Hydrotalea sp.]|uniref:Asp-tRNA(Asn)/Glu-tRNA(Gln) amidotransferase subunit GatA n=1 Tax=Hydrotalea sp. TaxID=2881279 RepID=UPI002629389F|nr:Asp-tRNA(Asn)/Glu-tRNA(Gln) amidotransferase subunit GatA [Hydrotalea sp.]